MSENNPILCRSRFVIPLSEKNRAERIEDGFILTVGSEIAEVGPWSEKKGEAILKQYGGNLKIMGFNGNAAKAVASGVPKLNTVMMPGFVKAHGHDHEQPLIGIAKDVPLTEWLDKAVNPFTGYINENGDMLTKELGMSPQLLTYLMARVADINYGITTSMVHHCNHSKYHAAEIARANEAAGTTMIVAIGGQDRFYYEALLDTPEEAVERLQKASEIEGLERTSFCPGPDQLFSNSRKVLVPLKAWARENNTLFHIHSSEEPKTTAWFKKEIEPGMTPVQYADSIGILDENSVLAHQVNCIPEDLEILAKTGTKIVHNPLANTILGSGMPPVIEMMKMGIPVAISTDGSGSADNQNIIAAARAAAQYQKAFHQDATLLKSEKLLEMITVTPSSILRKNQGELSPGKQADFVLLDLNQPNMIPTRLDNVMENIIWAANGSEISTVVASGRILKEDYRIRDFIDGTKPDEIMAKVQHMSELYAEYRKTMKPISGTGAHK
ncbi:amidohydrolase family protein [Spirochaeta isovalerica]|uniref:5-methylthioadenosine/S-adenosylhomocysteine deaminase n=1 Tax=Spirochaeta isovalerica TaxID=150 RepID=A0A841RA47_9SPIO|nr:amidohydrolase family protein [Spirochaeta isovalerica]MBB6479322.1 5-methylthioadenosine/S-adenosylhomocysteine deaminase [Spirochaeta isovalerica]